MDKMENKTKRSTSDSHDIRLVEPFIGTLSRRPRVGFNSLLVGEATSSCTLLTVHPGPVMSLFSGWRGFDVFDVDVGRNGTANLSMRAPTS